MKRRMILPFLFGLAGLAVLMSLGIWQVQRLVWKQAVIAEISARIGAGPVALPATPDREADRYLPVRAEGVLTGQDLVVLASLKQIGPLYRLISVLDTGGRRVLVDRGYVRVADRPKVAAVGPYAVTGNLHWPQEVDGFTPQPDRAQAMWFARDVDAMAAELGTEPLLIVARQSTDPDPGVTPLPVSPSGIPNDHLQYAITWFSLALVWLGMTAYLLWRIRQRTV